MKNIKICVPVTGKNLDDFLENLNKIEKVCDFVELRADFLENLKLEDVDVIAREVKMESIFTCRKKDEGGKFEGSEKERLKILEEAMYKNFNYVDIELSSVDQIDFSERNKQTKIICSYHNFDKTPTYEYLEEIVNQMKEKGVDVFKIAIMSYIEEDNKKLLKLLLNRDKDEEMIVIGMGENGKMTRILSPLLGGYLTYANVDGGVTAQGQINIEELKNIYKSFPSFNKSVCRRGREG